MRDARARPASRPAVASLRPVRRLGDGPPARGPPPPAGAAAPAGRAAGGRWRRARALAPLGPGVLVAVGYVDPGNWSTDLAAGSRFAYALLPVVVLASLVALLVQVLSARLGVASGRDLAEVTRDLYPRAAPGLWILAELAMVATDLAELLGAAIGLRLLFGLPLVAGVGLTGLDALLLLCVPRKGTRLVELVVAGLLVAVATGLAVELVLARPDAAAVARGLVPHVGVLRSPEAIYLALGIVGATVMPHNLYLHSSLVRGSADGAGPEERRRGVRRTALASAAALSCALVLNAVLLVLAATALPGGRPVSDLSEAYRLLGAALGGAAAPVFAIALVAASESATVTGTLAGQAVLTGFTGIRWRPAVRRIVTRSVALAPAIAVTLAAGDAGAESLLVLSQVALALQLPFAVVPLLRACGDHRIMGSLVAPRWMRALGWAAAAGIVAANVALLAFVAAGWVRPR